ncbi:MAG TPA: hypothetical protein VH951_10800 [Dehalococcoidia bacterium]
MGGQAVISAYRELGRRVGKLEADVAVWSSATAEDPPEVCLDPDGTVVAQYVRNSVHLAPVHEGGSTVNVTPL